MKEYYYSPNPPKATEMVNMVEAAVVNRNGEILMTRKNGDTKWELPKGAAILGRSLDDSAMDLIDHGRLCIETADIIALYSNPHILFEDENTHSVRQEVVTLYYMKEMFCEKQEDTNDVSWQWVNLQDLDAVSMPYSVRLHMRDVLNFATKKRKRICADDGEKCFGPSCFLIKEKRMTETLLKCYSRRNSKTFFVDVKEIKNILAKCEDEDEKDKTIKKWSNARHGIVFDNFDICFGDKELQQILLRIVSFREKRHWVTDLLIYQSFYDNVEKINDELYMILVTSFYHEVNNDKDLQFLSKFLTRYCHLKNIE